MFNLHLAPEDESLHLETLGNKCTLTAGNVPEEDPKFYIYWFDMKLVGGGDW
jgi:hypothetical protein